MKKMVHLAVHAFVLMLVIPGVALAQRTFEKGNIVLNAGPVLFGRAVDVALAGEYGVSNKLGVGLRVTSGHLTNRSAYSGISAGAFVNYHPFTLARIDPFVGLALSKTTYTREASGSDNFSGLQTSIQAGVRYFVADRFGLYTQGQLAAQRGVMSVAEIGAVLRIGK